MLPLMTLLKIAPAAALALGVGLVASACSSTPEPPQAFVMLVMSASRAMPGLCVGYPSDTTIMQVGEPGNPNALPKATQPTRISTGAQSVEIVCSVHPTGSTYDVNLQIRQGDMGMGSSSLTVVATNVDPVNGAMNVSGTVSNSQSGDYTSSACTISFKTPGAGAQPAGSPVEPGRIWAHLSCDETTNSAIQVGTPSNPQSSTCDAEVDFIFENCSM
jgi:hypothetical protein